MSKAPGHQKWPDHKVQEQHMGQRFQVEINGELIADSDDVIRVEEDQHPPRYYFPRSDVRMELLERSATTTECPFKGTARHYDLRTEGKDLPNAAWSYENPYQEHESLKDRVAFYDDEMSEIVVQSGI